VHVLFEVSDPDDTDGFFARVSKTVEEACPDVTLVPFHFDTRWEQKQRGGVVGVEFFRLSDVPNLFMTPEAIEAGIAFRNSLGYESTRFLSMKMLNRMDFSGTFRMLEREILFQQGVMFAIQTLLRIGPSLIVFRVTPHEFLPFLLHKVADFLGIEVLHFQPCSVAPVLFARFSSAQNPWSPLFLPPGSEITDFVESCANRALNSLADKNSPRYITSQITRDKNSSRLSSRFRAVRNSIKWLLVARFPNEFDLTGHGRRDTFVARIVRLLLSRSLALTLRFTIRGHGVNQGGASPFALFALHYEPERTSIPDGLPVDHQLDAVMDTRALLPSHFKLLVKEHYSQQSSALRGYLGRSPSFYQLIDRFPNTEMAPFAGDSAQLLKGAACVVTLTGTIGIEAALAGTPALYYGSPWWSGMPGAIHRSELGRFTDFETNSMPDRGSVMAFLVNRILNEGLPGLGSESITTIEENFGKLPKGFRQSEADAISQIICSFAR
jgi:hypothetical protein